MLLFLVETYVTLTSGRTKPQADRSIALFPNPFAATIPRVFRHVPNLLTGARLLLAIVFFALLSWYQFEGRGDNWLLTIAFFIYVIAMFTDFLDGYLARKWQVEGAFGRVVDPFVDKVLVLGSFAFFAGKNFVIPDTVRDISPSMVAKPITGVVPAMVVVIMARELLVTSLRGSSEGSGQNFGAAFSGKLKMVVQSATILVILVYVDYFQYFKQFEWAKIVRDLFIWTTIVVTLVSGFLYIQRAISLYREKRIVT
ncbi:MAG TPA: CDP-alcohol phosphatidyltransferase family protein [Tepidisphaeraceae bacterium]|jgi:CDP-diacylglycerol--glycerol-3-phosphate 3-phosphatidyltransferase|nr:CDP-alcohol phosphatidyltransferase family protein [Tepidisphaeraceae bacterium]